MPGLFFFFLYHPCRDSKDCGNLQHLLLQRKRSEQIFSFKARHPSKPIIIVNYEVNYDVEMQRDLQIFDEVFVNKMLLSVITLSFLRHFKEERAIPVKRGGQYQGEEKSPKKHTQQRELRLRARGTRQKGIKEIILELLLFECTMQHVGSQFQNLCSLHWEHEILTVGAIREVPGITFLRYKSSLPKKMAVKSSNNGDWKTKSR